MVSSIYNLNKTYRKIFAGFISVIILSAFFFPFGLNAFMPSQFNTKIGLAILGFFYYIYICSRGKEILIKKELLLPICFSIIFSLVCYISIDLNNTGDYSYAFYIGSFATWLSAGYITCVIIKHLNKRLRFFDLVFYLSVVCVLQCVIALLIDNLESFKNFVDFYISQETVANSEFLNKVNRLYGVGAALDPAGTRFSIVLLCIAAVLVKDIGQKEIYKPYGLWFWFAFIFITVVGNIISRTTLIGTLLGIALIFSSVQIRSLEVKRTQLNLIGQFLLVAFPIVLLSIYFYNYDKNTQHLIRYGFEGFFNWAEHGEWKTSSTELLRNAWKWPHDRIGWIIGYGQFADWVFDTDIGYCRFILYSGLSGMIIFSVFFIFNAILMIEKLPKYTILFVYLLALSFIIWLKVSTDLFLIYALLFFVDKESNNTREWFSKIN